MIEITLSGVQFEVEEFEVEERGLMMTFRDPDSGILVNLPVTREQAEAFVERVGAMLGTDG